MAVVGGMDLVMGVCVCGSNVCVRVCALPAAFRARSSSKGLMAPEESSSYRKNSA